MSEEVDARVRLMRERVTLLEAGQGVMPSLRECFVAQLGVSEEVDARVRLMRERVTLEARLQASLVQLQGTLEPILHAALALEQAPVLEE